jgi:lipopolysaccharide transport system permease protein
MIEARESTVAASRAGDGRAASPESQVEGHVLDPSAELPEIVIRPRSGWIPIDWKELFAYRELFIYLVWRDVAARYKQTILGPAWAVLQPLILMGIFCFLSLVVKIPTPQINGVEIPYPVFVFASLIPWTLFSQGMPSSATSLVNNQHIITKVYFPRLFVPTTAATVFMVDLMISLVIYAVILLCYRTPPAWTVIFLPLLILMTMISTLGIGISLASLTLFYRDFRHVVPFLVQIMMYATPVLYSASLFTDKNPRLGWFLALNPMFGNIDAYRAVILGAPLNVATLVISSVTGLLLFVFSLFYFRRTERRFADFA